MRNWGFATLGTIHIIQDIMIQRSRSECKNAPVMTCAVYLLLEVWEEAWEVGEHQGTLLRRHLVLLGLKGIVSRDEYFFKVLKVTSIPYIYALMVFKLFWCLMEKMEIHVFACFYETPTNFEDPYWNPLKNAWCDIQQAPCDSVNCSVSRRWFWKIQNFLKRVWYYGTF